MSNISVISRRNAAHPNAALSRPEQITTQAHAERVEHRAASGRELKPTSQLLCGLTRPSTRLETQEFQASAEQRAAFAAGLVADLANDPTKNERKATARFHETGVSEQFMSDAPRTAMLLVPQGGDWREGEDIRPPSRLGMRDTVSKLTDFCDGDANWARRISQVANQTLANSAFTLGFVGPHGLAGRFYRRHDDTQRLIVKCDTRQSDATAAAEHERMELQRVGADTLRITWHRSRDITNLHLRGRAQPKKLGHPEAGYTTLVSVEVDRPRPNEDLQRANSNELIRTHTLMQRVRLPRPLDP